jgi:hypothetical protein
MNSTQEDSTAVEVVDLTTKAQELKKPILRKRERTSYMRLYRIDSRIENLEKKLNNLKELRDSKFGI